ncbi:hypothetical protein HYDPIDRAFT_187978 [Hydnomerulius pinastri MD-312]|uniref:Unplaced genomic scaffold scaffold_13, whole genome shotgun sequence n=1 Tax=Hydnomerulius pinastri MD-312 TaxID=994086 RepID=A0A0C9WET5_9AGAM|nr:hypothetical protein HYDPIDRAFT_187978 [Hydnomerulius pinastri MD-312]
MTWMFARAIGAFDVSESPDISQTGQEVLAPEIGCGYERTAQMYAAREDGCIVNHSTPSQVVPQSFKEQVITDPVDIFAAPWVRNPSEIRAEQGDCMIHLTSCCSIQERSGLSQSGLQLERKRVPKNNGKKGDGGKAQKPISRTPLGTQSSIRGNVLQIYPPALAVQGAHIWSSEPSTHHPG